MSCIHHLPLTPPIPPSRLYGTPLSLFILTTIVTFACYRDKNLKCRLIPKDEVARAAENLLKPDPNYDENVVLPAYTEVRAHSRAAVGGMRLSHVMATSVELDPKVSDSWRVLGDATQRLQVSPNVSNGLQRSATVYNCLQPARVYPNQPTTNHQPPPPEASIR